MGDPLNLDAFLGLGARTRLSLAAERPPQDQTPGNTPATGDKSWREAWQRAMEQSQSADWAGWFTGPPRPVAADLSASRLPIGIISGGNQMVPTSQAVEQSLASRASFREKPDSSVPGTQGMQETVGASAIRSVSAAPEPDQAGPNTVMRGETLRSGGSEPTQAFLGKAPGQEGDHVPFLTDASPSRPAIFSPEEIGDPFQFSSALTQGLTGSLSSGAALSLETQTASGLAPNLSGPPTLIGALPAFPVAGMAEAQSPVSNGPSVLEPPMDRSSEASEVHAKAQVLSGEIQTSTSVRLTAETSEQGVRVWLGVDFDREAELAPELAQLTLHIQQWLASQGEKLVSLICNGREVWRDTLDSKTNAFHQEAPRPVLSALPPLIPRKPV